MNDDRSGKCRGSGERTDLWIPVDRPVGANLPAVKKCPYCGESLRLVKDGDGYRFPVHEEPASDADSDPEA